VPSTTLLGGAGSIVRLLIIDPSMGSNLFSRHLEPRRGLPPASQEATAPAYRPPQEAFRLFHLREKRLLHQRVDVAKDMTRPAYPSRWHAPRFTEDRGGY